MRRRDPLAGAAASTVAPAASSARPSDPVLALAERHRAALAAYLEAAAAREAAQAAFEAEHEHMYPLPLRPDPRAVAYDAELGAKVGPLARAQERAFEVESELFAEMLATEATTPAGIAAKIETALLRDHEWHGDSAEDLLPVLRSVLADLRRLSAA